MAQMLWREFARLGWRRREPGRVPTDYPVRMEALVDSALRSKLVTVTELSRISGIAPEAIKARVLEAMGARELRRDDHDPPPFRISEYLDEGHSSEV
jgi:hypothetical protein